MFRFLIYLLYAILVGYALFQSFKMQSLGSRVNGIKTLNEEQMAERRVRSRRVLLSLVAFIIIIFVMYLFKDNTNLL